MAMFDLRLGRWQDVLSDVVACDALITDPPYLSACINAGAGAWAGGGLIEKAGPVMGYDPASEEMLTEIVGFAARVCRGWFVAFNDFDGAHVIRREVKARGAVSSEPIAWVKPPTLTPPRGFNNLPAKGTEFIVSSRFGVVARTGIIPGSYVSPSSTPGPSHSLVVTGGKPLDLMRAIIRDYTRPGDLVVDPCAGGGTTLLAAMIEGRRAIGAEMDPDTYAKAKARLERGHTPDMFSGGM